MASLGQKISALRKKRGLSQAQLAEKLGIGTSTLGMYETNKREPSYQTLVAIADFFNTSVDDLLGREKMNSSNKEIMARNIKFYLNQKNITVKDFSKQLGFKYSTVLDWVHANTYPRIDKIEAMANYFNIDKSDLVEEHKKIDNKLTATDLTNPILAFDGRPIVGDQAQKIRDFVKFLLQEEDKNKNGDGE